MDSNEQEPESAQYNTDTTESSAAINGGRDAACSEGGVGSNPGGGGDVQPQDNRLQVRVRSPVGFNSKICRVIR